MHPISFALTIDLFIASDEQQFSLLLLALFASIYFLFFASICLHFWHLKLIFAANKLYTYKYSTIDLFIPSDEQHFPLLHVALFASICCSIFASICLLWLPQFICFFASNYLLYFCFNFFALYLQAAFVALPLDLPTTNARSKDTFAFWWITCRKLDLELRAFLKCATKLALTILQSYTSVLVEANIRNESEINDDKDKDTRSSQNVPEDRHLQSYFSVLVKVNIRN